MSSISYISETYINKMFIEDKNFLTDNDKKYIHENILNLNTLPLYWNDRTGPAPTDNQPFLSHVLIARDRNEKISPHTDFFINVLNTFCKKNKIKIEKIFRGCINLTFTLASNIKNTKGIIHKDHNFPHKQFILYLNNSDGRTILLKNKKPWKKIKPHMFKAICFDGLNEHYAETPLKNQKRIIVVMTFI